METIRGVPEAVEDKTDFAGSIVSRDESLSVYASTPGLGPPDLCWLQKATKGAWATAAQEPRGFFHYCLGRDVSSSAAIAAYFADLNAKVDPIGLMQGLWYSSETQIQRGFYCCYDPFTRLDVRCELCIPGGVVCGALDAQGTVHAVTPEMWRNCAVASFLRHQLADPDLTTHAMGILHRWDPLPTSGAEATLLEAVLEMYRTSVLPQSLDLVTADPARGCTPEHMDLVLHTVYNYLALRHRWQVALGFFAQLQTVHMNAAVYLAALQRELDSFEDSFATLNAALEVCPTEPCLLLSLATECLYCGQVDTAAKLARKAVRVQSSLRPAWLLLARCYIKQGLFSLALVTLNVVPPPPMPMPEQEMLFGVPPPDPKYVTKPTVPRYDPDVRAAKQLSTEEVAADGSRSLLYLPAAVMIPREPLDLGPWPDIGPSRITRAVLSAGYFLLQEMVSATGWDSFLEMRARVFVMQSETQGSKVAQRQPAVQEEEEEEAGEGEEERDEEEAGQGRAVGGGEGKGTYYDKALEELAAMGMGEHQEEVLQAREANRQVALEAERMQASLDQQQQQTRVAATLLRNEETSSHNSPMGGALPRLAPTPAAPSGGGGAPSEAASAVSAAGPAASTGAAVAAAAGMPVPSVITAGERSGGGARLPEGKGAPAMGDGDAQGGQAPATSFLGALAPGSSLPSLLSSTTSALWGVMFGASSSARTQLPRLDLAEAQFAQLQQYDSTGLNSASNSDMHTGAALPRPQQQQQPVAEAVCGPYLGPGAGTDLDQGVLAATATLLATWVPLDSATASAAALHWQRVRAASAACKSSVQAAAAGERFRCRRGEAPPSLLGWLALAVGGVGTWSREGGGGVAPGAGPGPTCPGAGKEAGWGVRRGVDRTRECWHSSTALCSGRGTAGPRATCTRLQAKTLPAALPAQPWLALGDAARPWPAQDEASNPWQQPHDGPAPWPAAPPGDAGPCLSPRAMAGAAAESRQRVAAVVRLLRAWLAAPSRGRPSPSHAVCEAQEAQPQQQRQASAELHQRANVNRHLYQEDEDEGRLGRHQAHQERLSAGRLASRRTSQHAQHEEKEEEEDGYGEEDYDSNEEEEGEDDMDEEGEGRRRPRRQVPGGGSGWHQASQQLLYPGGTLSSLSMDRGFALLGASAVEEVQRSKAKRLCVRWLDELIIALWHDLQAYMECKTLDSELQERQGGSLAVLTLGLATPSAAAPGGGGEGPEAQQQQRSNSLTSAVSASGAAVALPADVPQLPAGDWMRRGLLAERLFHDAEALLAYRCCLASGPFNLLAAHAVMRLAAEAGDARLALGVCAQLLAWHVTQLPAQCQPAFAPTWAACCLGNVTSLMSPDALQALAEQVMQALVEEVAAAAAAAPALTVAAVPVVAQEAANAWLKKLLAAVVVAAAQAPQHA